MVLLERGDMNASAAFSPAQCLQRWLQVPGALSWEPHGLLGVTNFLKPRFERCASSPGMDEASLSSFQFSSHRSQGMSQICERAGSWRGKRQFCGGLSSSSGSVRKLSRAGMNNFFQCSPKSGDVGIVNPVFIDEKSQASRSFENLFSQFLRVRLFTPKLLSFLLYLAVCFTQYPPQSDPLVHVLLLCWILSLFSIQHWAFHILGSQSVFTDWPSVL